MGLVRGKMGFGGEIGFGMDCKFLLLRSFCRILK